MALRPYAFHPTSHCETEVPKTVFASPEQRFAWPALRLVNREVRNKLPPPCYRTHTGLQPESHVYRWVFLKLTEGCHRQNERDHDGEPGHPEDLLPVALGLVWLQAHAALEETCSETNTLSQKDNPFFPCVCDMSSLLHAVFECVIPFNTRTVHPFNACTA